MTIHVAADALTDFSAEVFERVDRKSGEGGVGSLGDAFVLLPEPARDLSLGAAQCPLPHEQREVSPRLDANGDSVERHSDLTAVAWGKATTSSSAAARTKIGASMSDSRARRPSAGKQSRANRFSRKTHSAVLEEVGAGQIDRARVPIVEPCDQRRVVRALQSRPAEFSRKLVRPEGERQWSGNPAAGQRHDLFDRRLRKPRRARA